jgi:hypothetical protein
MMPHYLSGTREVCSVCIGTELPGRFFVRFQPGTKPLQRDLPHENPDRRNEACFTTQIPGISKSQVWLLLSSRVLIVL